MFAPVRILQVGELNSLIRADLEEDPDLQDVYVEAEIGNCTKSAAGHRYLTLKDARSGQVEQAVIKAVLFRGQAQGLAFEPETGQRVIAHGRISVYVSRGDMQLYLDRLEPTGVGALALAFQQLVAKLESEGLFDESRKRPLPFLPRRVAVVTSPRGAAVRDVIHVVRRRCPIVEVLVVPTLVQGDGSPQEIVGALELASQAEVDVVLLVRGGGSMEDLQAFNTEVVARAVAACRHPVIAGVGHETDTSVVDFIADRRAPTPSVAAELAVPELAALQAELAARRLRLRREALGRFETERDGLAHLGLRLERMAPLARVETGRQDLDRALGRLTISAHRLLRAEVLALQSRAEMLTARGPVPRLLRAREEFGGRVGRLEALSPLRVLGRGYSITFRGKSGQVVRDSTEVQVGEEITTHLHRGRLHSQVIALEQGKEESDGA